MPVASCHSPLMYWAWDNDSEAALVSAAMDDLGHPFRTRVFLAMGLMFPPAHSRLDGRVGWVSHGGRWCRSPILLVLVLIHLECTGTVVFDDGVLLEIFDLDVFAVVLGHAGHIAGESQVLLCWPMSKPGLEFPSALEGQ